MIICELTKAVARTVPGSVQTPNALVSQSEGDHVVTAPGSDALFTAKRSRKGHLGTGVH